MSLPPKPPAKTPPRGGPMSPPPVRSPGSRPPAAPSPSRPPPGPAATRPAAPVSAAPARGQPNAPASNRALPTATLGRILAAKQELTDTRAPAKPAGQVPPRTGSTPLSRTNAATPPRPDSAAGQARTARIAAAGATGTVGQVIEAVRLVDAVLAEENIVLRRHDAAGAAVLQERKLAATRLYHERMRALARDTEAARAMTLEERGELARLARGLDERVRENAILLRATMEAIDRLFGCINQAVQQKVKKEVSYSRAGLVAANASPAASSIAFNRTV